MKEVSDPKVATTGEAFESRPPAEIQKARGELQVSRQPDTPRPSSFAARIG